MKLARTYYGLLKRNPDLVRISRSSVINVRLPFTMQRTHWFDPSLSIVGDGENCTVYGQGLCRESDVGDWKVMAGHELDVWEFFSSRFPDRVESTPSERPDSGYPEFYGLYRTWIEPFDTRKGYPSEGLRLYEIVVGPYSKLEVIAQNHLQAEENELALAFRGRARCRDYSGEVLRLGYTEGFWFIKNPEPTQELQTA